MRLHTVIAVLLLAAVACSSPDRARRMSPTGPSAATTVGTGPMGLGGISGPMDVLFPSRADAFEFRNQLEAKYQTGLGRSTSLTSVDREGEVVWTQEYIRYRVNGCDHPTAIAARDDADRWQPAGRHLCRESRLRDPVPAARSDPWISGVSWRPSISSRWAAAPAPTFVDMEGSVIWTQEYLRYRVNECDHSSAVQKVIAQIDGGAVSATCVPACRYRASPGDRRAQRRPADQLLRPRRRARWLRVDRVE